MAPRIQVVICNTRAPRALTGSEYAERRAQCEEGARILATFYPGIQALRDVSLEQLSFHHRRDFSDLVYRQCRFIIEENQRVLGLADVLARGDRKETAALTNQSYAGARDLYEIVSREMACMMDAMLSSPGVIGARQAAAGFGGCMVAFVEESQAGRFAQHVEAHYHAASGIEPQVYPVQAAAGAGRLGQSSTGP